MKKLITLVAMTLSITVAGSALAHGAKPKHGGIVATGNDLQFELVNKNNKPLIYVEDHGQKLSTAGATGKLTVLNGKEKSEYTMQPVDDNALAVNGDVRLVSRTKAVAAITFDNKKAATVRFSIK